MGGIAKTATGAPSYRSVRPDSTAPLALMSKFNGFPTAQFGKSRKVPVWHTSPAGPLHA
jgi:arylsulfatase